MTTKADSSIEAIEKLSPFWRDVLMFGKSVMVCIWHFGLILIGWLVLSAGSYEGVLDLATSTIVWAFHTIIFAMALGFDALAIVRTLGIGRGEKPPQPVHIVSTSTQTPERPEQP